MKKPKPPFEQARDKAEEAILILDGQAHTPETRQAYVRLQEGRMWLMQQVENDKPKKGKDQ